MTLRTTDFPTRNQKLRDCCAYPVAKNRRVNVRHSAAGMVMWNAVSCLRIFGFISDSKSFWQHLQHISRRNKTKQF